MGTAQDLLLKTMNRIHEPVFKATNGRLLGNLAGMPALILHTTGRKSGLPRTAMLTSPVQDGDTVVLVASKGGADHHPTWYHNLIADPDVAITMRGEKEKPMRARVASADEKAELWPRITGTYKGYAGYQSKTDRDIPVVILEPR